MTSPKRRRSLTVLVSSAMALALVSTAGLPALANHEVVIDVDDGVSVTEGGGTDSFTIEMGYSPDSDGLVDESMQVDIESLNPAEATVDVAQHTFAEAEVGQPITVTVTGQGADDVTDGDVAVVIRVTTSSANPVFDGLVRNVAVTVTDDEVAGITLGAVSGTTAEPNGTATFTAVLDARPTATVTVAVATTDPTEATASGPLEFTDGNWDEPQTITLTGVDDDMVDGTIAYDVDLTASGGGYDGVVAQTSSSTTDDDVAGITVDPTADLAVTEAGGTDSFTVVLDTKPSASVTIDVTSSDTTEAIVDKASLEFTTDNWNTAQTVTVTGVADATVDADQPFTIQLAAAASADTDYDGFDPDDVTGVTANNDVAPPPPAPPAPSETFNDLGDLNEETVAAIETLVELEITQGTSETTYSPTAPVTRWQMALFVARQLVAHGVVLPEPTSQGFTDLSGLSEEAIQSISQIAALDVTQGTTATTYSPDGEVTRWQMALFMTRVLAAAGVELPAGDPTEFDDISQLDAATQVAIGQLAELGVVFGTGEGQFSPNEPVSRWQMALFIVRTLEAAGDLPD